MNSASRATIRKWRQSPCVNIARIGAIPRHRPHDGLRQRPALRDTKHAFVFPASSTSQPDSCGPSLPSPKWTSPRHRPRVQLDRSRTVTASPCPGRSCRRRRAPAAPTAARPAQVAASGSRTCCHGRTACGRRTCSVLPACQARTASGNQPVLRPVAAADDVAGARGRQRDAAAPAGTRSR